MTQATNLLVWSLIAHWAADWIFQTDWMAAHKSNLRHPAAWVHGGIHALFTLFVLPWNAALIVALLHMLIDTRYPLHWWRWCVGKQEGSASDVQVNIWVDQVFHVVTLAAVALSVAAFK